MSSNYIVIIFQTDVLLSVLAMYDIDLNLYTIGLL